MLNFCYYKPRWNVMITDKTIKKINHYIVLIAGKRLWALDKLFEMTKKPLYVVACSYLNDRSKAEDVLSDSYLKVVRSAHTFDKKLNGYNWLYEIVKNTALNQSLKEIDQPNYEIIEELCNGILVESAQKSLSEQEKKMIYDYYFAGKSLREIAESMNKPKTTIYDSLQSILSKMRKSMDDTER